MLKTFVKIGSINNLSDARYCAGMMVNQLGFSLDSGTINKELFEAITGWVEGVDLVGEFEGTDVNAIKTILLEFEISHIQVTEASVLEELYDNQYQLILKTDISNISSLTSKYNDYVDYFILEDHNITIQQLEQIQNKDRIVLSSLIEPENIDTIQTLGFKGIAMNGGEEIRPGVKDFDQLADVLEILEID